MAVTMAFTSVPVFANSGSGTAIGEGTAEMPVLSLNLPMNLNFTMDPFGMDATIVSENTGQLQGNRFEIFNNSGAPVQIGVQLNPLLATGVLHSTTNNQLHENLNPAVVAKNIRLEVMVATAVDRLGTPAAPNALNETNGATFVPGTAQTRLILNDTVDTNRIGFILDGGVENQYAANNTAAAFLLRADMNPMAPWETGDVRITGAFRFNLVTNAAMGTAADAGTLLHAAENDVAIQGHRRAANATVNTILDANPILGFGANVTNFVRQNDGFATLNIFDSTTIPAGAFNVPFFGAGDALQIGMMVNSGPFAGFAVLADPVAVATASTATNIVLPADVIDLWRGATATTDWYTAGMEWETTLHIQTADEAWHTFTLMLNFARL